MDAVKIVIVAQRVRVIASVQGLFLKVTLDRAGSIGVVAGPVGIAGRAEHVIVTAMDLIRTDIMDNDQ